jgi:hypothetical protein
MPGETKKEKRARELKQRTSDASAAADRMASEGSGPTADGKVDMSDADSVSASDTGRSKVARTSSPLPEAPAGGVAAASSPSTAAPAAPAVEPAAAHEEPSLASLTELIKAMALNLALNTEAVMKKADATAATVSSLSEQFNQFQNETNAKFAALAATPPAVSSAPSSSKWAHQGEGATPMWKKSEGGASSGAGAPATAAASAEFIPRPVVRPVPAAAGAASEFGRKIIARGFPRPLPRNALVTWWTWASGFVSHELHSKGTFQGGNGSAFSVVFPSREDARLFTAALNDRKDELLWASPRQGEGSFKINFKAEKSVDDANRGKAMAGAWRVLSPLIRESPAFGPDMKFQTDTKKGVIAVSTPLDMWPLLRLEPSPTGYNVVINDTNLKHLAEFGIGPETAELARCASATAAAGQ